MFAKVASQKKADYRCWIGLKILLKGCFLVRLCESEAEELDMLDEI